VVYSLAHLETDFSLVVGASFPTENNPSAVDEEAAVGGNVVPYAFDNVQYSVGDDVA
jgi:hypothetical protein